MITRREFTTIALSGLLVRPSAVARGTSASFGETRRSLGEGGTGSLAAQPLGPRKRAAVRRAP